MGGSKDAKKVVAKRRSPSPQPAKTKGIKGKAQPKAKAPPPKPTKPAVLSKTVKKKAPPPPQETDDDESSMDDDSETDDDDDDFEDDTDDSQFEDSMDTESDDPPKKSTRVVVTTAAARKTAQKAAQLAAAAAAKKKADKLTEKQLARVAERAAEKAADRAVERAADRIRESVAKEAKRATRVSGRTRRREESDSEEERPRMRRRGDAEAFAAQRVRVARQGVQYADPAGSTPAAEAELARQSRRIVTAGGATRSTRVVHQDASGGPAQGERAAGGPVVVHRQLNASQVRSLLTTGNPTDGFGGPRFGGGGGGGGGFGGRGGPRGEWTPQDAERSRRIEREIADLRVALGSKLRKLMDFEGTEAEKCRHIINGIGGEGALVVGESYQCTEQAEHALRDLVRAWMCRKNPKEVVVTLLYTGGRYIAKVFAGGEEVHSEGGPRNDGSREDPVIRTVRNAIVFADLQQQPKQQKKKEPKKEIETIDLDEVDDDMGIDEDEA